MGFAFIREGDTTTHGGHVLACNAANLLHGKPIALVGDMVSCPKCGGVYPIVDVKNSLGVRFDDRAVASEGDKTACGATLLASQHFATASPTSGAGAPVGGGKSVVAEQQGGDDAKYRGRFQLVDDATRTPIPNHRYTVKSPDGQIIRGTTDATGHTDWLNTRHAASLSFNQAGTADPSDV
ncbi:PAAR domain-containing protein (plasmid) [Paraburkholderia sp. D15]|uniref:PAAR domain-containing protein n=1 Tax=Paraburkholderia sp. D15 TaxID=2880218 RepID=UPI00247AD79E|nr:PAAR domain-containing protein [Paraburkholderia sp. D15]WGS54917.1 PAAR domain-containing protein [Paraburkholderia sp. D15]